MTISFGSTAVPVAAPVEVPKKKRTLLPLLTVLFLFSYVLMTLLIVQQGSVIQSQGNLIKVLMRDSKELWTAKGKAIGDKQMAEAQAQSRAHSPAANTPSSQTHSAQAPSSPAPSNQPQANQPQANQPQANQAPQNRAQNHGGKIARPQPQAPPVPASDLVDQRRGLTSI